MNEKSRAWLIGKWASLLTMATWVVPIGGVPCLVRSAAALPAAVALPPEEEEAFVTAFGDMVDEIITDADYNTPEITIKDHDFTGDGILDELTINPGIFHEPDGWIFLRNGATGGRIYRLESAPTELGFGEYVGTLNDMNGDNLRELIVLTGIPIAGTTQARVVARIHSGHNGSLLGAVKAAVPSLSISEEVEVAGDINGDGVVNSEDIVQTAAAVGQIPEAGRDDLDVDGEVTAVDVMLVSARAQIDQQGALSAAIQAAIVNVNTNGTGFVAITGGPGAGQWQGGFHCWWSAGALAVNAALLISGALACGASTLAPPAAIACIIAWCCAWANFLAELMTWAIECWGGQFPPGLQEALEVISDLTNWCGAGANAIGAWGTVLEKIKRFFKEFQHIA